MRHLVGTSGYSYREWKGEGKFYPPRTSAAKMLRFYAERFATVEMNNTFYDFPDKDALVKQAAQVPPGFTFAVKAPGKITHQKRLVDVGEPVKELFSTLAVLGPRLGPVLFGLPPNFKKDVPRLKSLLSVLPRQRRVAVEFRHPSWFDDEVYALLRKARVALCVADADDLATPLVATTSWGYVRLRREKYSKAALAGWAASIQAQGWSDALVYFKHEDTGRAPKLARRFLTLPGVA
jgi:uncharacterized protein YecE (DUF72 family)